MIAAKPGGRTSGRIAQQSKRATTPRKKLRGNHAALQTGLTNRTTPKTEPNQVPEAEAALRRTWKGRQRDAEALAKIQHGALVDQRAHVRATTGQHGTARKTH
jgi:hypothetical protein